jgi:hypothetical protein
LALACAHFRVGNGTEHALSCVSPWLGLYLLLGGGTFGAVAIFFIAKMLGK